MIIGAKATIGTVWLMIAQGITDMSITRNRTIAIASSEPAMIPSPNPIIVPLNVTNP